MDLTQLNQLIRLANQTVKRAPGQKAPKSPTPDRVMLPVVPHILTSPDGMQLDLDKTLVIDLVTQTEIQYYNHRKNYPSLFNAETDLIIARALGIKQKYIELERFPKMNPAYIALPPEFLVLLRCPNLTVASNILGTYYATLYRVCQEHRKYYQYPVQMESTIKKNGGVWVVKDKTSIANKQNVKIPAKPH